MEFLVNEAARGALRVRMPISLGSFVAAMERIPPSVLPEVEEQYQNIEQRGSE
jgi:hypothetical protein